MSNYIYSLGVIVFIAIVSTYSFSILGCIEFNAWTIGAVVWLLFAGSIMLLIILRAIPPTVYLVKDEGEDK